MFFLKTLNEDVSLSKACVAFVLHPEHLNLLSHTNSIELQWITHWYNLWVLRCHLRFQAWLSAWGATVQGQLPLCGRQSAATWANCFTGLKLDSGEMLQGRNKKRSQTSTIVKTNLRPFSLLMTWSMAQKYCQAQKWQRERSTGFNITRLKTKNKVGGWYGALWGVADFNFKIFTSKAGNVVFVGLCKRTFQSHDHFSMAGAWLQSGNWCFASTKY